METDAPEGGDVWGERMLVGHGEDAVVQETGGFGPCHHLCHKRALLLFSGEENETEFSLTGQREE